MEGYWLCILKLKLAVFWMSLLQAGVSLCLYYVIWQSRGFLCADSHHTKAPCRNFGCMIYSKSQMIWVGPSRETLLMTFLHIHSVARAFWVFCLMWVFYVSFDQCVYQGTYHIVGRLLAHQKFLYGNGRVMLASNLRVGTKVIGLTPFLNYGKCMLCHFSCDWRSVILNAYD